MPIEVISEHIQRNAVNDNNKKKEAAQKIPLCTRNFNSGWPLIQISLLIPTDKKINNEVEYEPGKAGGACMQFNPGLLGMMILLSRITGKGTLKADHKQFEAKNIDWNIAFACDHGFDFHDHVIGIDIKYRSPGYSQRLELNFAGLTEIQINRFFKELRTVPNSTNILKNLIPSEIQECYDSNIVIFFEGQIFVDMEKVVDACNDPEIKEYFANYFKPSEALNLFKQNELYPEFIPTSHVKQVNFNEKYGPILTELGAYLKSLDSVTFIMPLSDFYTKSAVRDAILIINNPGRTTPHQFPLYITSKLREILCKHKDILPDLLLPYAEPTLVDKVSGGIKKLFS